MTRTVATTNAATSHEDARPKTFPKGSLTLPLGPAANVTFVLSNYDKYSLAERVSYHFLLTEALANSSREIADPNKQTDPINELQSKQNPAVGGSNAKTDINLGREIKGKNQDFQQQKVCGVKLLLECIPFDATLLRREKRALRMAIIRANQIAEVAASDQNNLCYEAAQLPLRINPSTRVFFAYQRTRIALLIDASPSLAATYGFSSSGHSRASCPLDLVPTMVRSYLKSLVEPIVFQDSRTTWVSQISITVMAVYPSEISRSASKAKSVTIEDIPSTSLLVRDFSLEDAGAVEKLIQSLENWLYSTVEEEIGYRLTQRDKSFLRGNWASPQKHQSYLRDWMEAGDAALSTMSSEARPLLAVVTDCRSVVCESVETILGAENHVDQPFSIIHVGPPSGNSNSEHQMIGAIPRPSISQLVGSDNGGSAFPMQVSNDQDSLYSICSATNGCFWNEDLLLEACRTRVGKIDTRNSSFAPDHFLRRHTIHPNVLQWYTLFSLSPLSPTTNSACGRLAPPASLSKKSSKATTTSADAISSDQNQQWKLPRHSVERFPGVVMDQVSFPIYVINPVRIQNLLRMRVQEGYRTIKYGTRTNEPDIVDVRFVLALDRNTSLRYQLSYKASAGYNYMVGRAEIGLALSGPSNFVQSVKQDYVRSADAMKSKLPSTSISARLCRMIRSIRQEDMLQSYLTPTKWNDQHLVKGAPFLRRLGTLSEMQRRRHFRQESFECVCYGNMPYNNQTDLFLNAFHDADTGEKGLLEALSEWSTQVVSLSGAAPGKQKSIRFLKKMESTSGGLASYCVVQLFQSITASRLYTVGVETFAGVSDNLVLLTALKSTIRGIKDVHVVEKQMSPYLVAIYSHHPLTSLDRHRVLLEKQHNHKSWDLMDDQELLPLLTKRRVEIDGFYLLESDDNYALLAKIEPGKDSGDPGDLVQYQIVKRNDRVVVDLHKESESSLFHGEFSASGSGFPRLSDTLETTDKECGRALRARTNLLASLTGSLLVEKQVVSLQTILPYVSKFQLKLHFFHSWSPSANETLKTMLQYFLLSVDDGAEIARLLSLDEPHETVEGFGPGDWFVAKYDFETMSLIHMSDTSRLDVASSDGTSLCYREFTFCTISISDLYFTRREDVGVEEYMSVFKLSQSVKSAHNKFYPMAAFSALRSDQGYHREIHMDDFMAIIRLLDWVEIAHVVVERGSAKLVELIHNLLEPVKGEQFYYFFKGVFEAESHRDHFPMLDGSDSSHGYQIHVSADNSSNFQNELAQQPDPEEAAEPPTAPLFFRFLVDGLPASAHDLSKIDKSSNVSAMVSIHKGEQEALPKTHHLAGSQLSKLLKAFTAAQTLERLRGAAIDEDALLAITKDAKMCLSRARDVEVARVDLLFYVSKMDRFVPGANEQAFRLFINELKSSSTIHLKSDGNEFVVVGIGEIFKDGELPFWCFITIKRRRGCVVIKGHHPAGPAAAKATVSVVSDELKKVCHRVNQLLLLQHMHSNRIASKFIVLPEDEWRGKQDPIRGSDEVKRNDFDPGFFECPVLFKYRFDLFHRAHPRQVAAVLESTVLHMFSCSNVPHLHVYKDEGGAVFYFRLDEAEGEHPGEGSLELHIHGVDMPTASMTTQLTKLLSRKLMQIGLDMLSVVVTKNPHYAWKEADISFIQNFALQWRAVDGGGASETHEVEKSYALPLEVFDPGMIMLYFRQNLCGSTYFQQLVESQAKSAETDAEVLGPSLVESLQLTCFFNNSPSKLNSELQSRSTLTARGEEYRQQAGTGLAIIEVSLEEKGTKPAQGVTIGCSIPNDWTLPTEGAVEIQNSESISRFSFRVKIKDTALHTDALHRWIKLTLDQVLAGWVIERELELQSQRTQEMRALSEDISETLFISKGLSTLVSLIDESNKMPHPAAKKWDSSCVVRSSMVATVALRLLDKAITEPFYAATKSTKKESLDRHIRVIRFSRNAPPVRVGLQWKGGETRRAFIRQFPEQRGGIVEDKPIDCPEYYISCVIPAWSKEESEGTRPSLPQLFSGVALQKGEEHLLPISPFAFRRSFAFVFHVTRNRIVLYAYNWDAALFDATSSLLEQELKSFLVQADTSNNVLQRRALGILSPLQRIAGNGRSVNETKGNIDDHEKSKVSGPSSGRRMRPIRQPKLIGKSIEGAAAHALAASRARASFKGVHTAPNRSHGGIRPKKRTTAPSPEETKKVPTNRLSKEESIIVSLREGMKSKISSPTRMVRSHTMQYWTARSMLENKLSRARWKETGCTADFFLFEFSLSTTRAFTIRFATSVVLDSLIEKTSSELAARSKDLKVVSLSRKVQVPQHSALLVTRWKLVRHVKCMGVITLRYAKLDGSHHVFFQAFNVTMKRRRRNFPHQTSTFEKDAAGSDIVAEGMFSHDIESVLFDCIASGPPVLDDDGVAMLKALETQYSLPRQLRNTNSRFKIFSLTIRLASYRHSLINIYSEKLFGWLVQNRHQVGMATAGSSALIFQTDMVVKGTHSTIILTNASSEKQALRLLLICRTNGKDINEYFFPPNQNVAITVATSIAIESAGVIYKELVVAATRLHLESLWNKARSNRASDTELAELLDLGHIIPITPAKEGDTLFAALKQDFFDHCESMLEDAAFLPSYKFVRRSDKASRWIFYFSSENLFLLAQANGIDPESEISFHILSPTGGDISDHCPSVLRRFGNYLLHRTWNSLC